MSRPEPHEWAEALNAHRWIAGTGCLCGADVAFVPHAAHQAEALAPLIEREREAAREEGMAAVAGPVLALVDTWERATQSRVEYLRASDLRAAIPTDAAEALARVRAEAKAEALREMRRLAVRYYPKGLVPTALVIADLEERITRAAAHEAGTGDES